MDHPTPFRILSLNGGGARGLLQAMYLDLISKKLGPSFWERFDLIIGTSAGAIVAACLCKKIPPSEIVRLFNEAGPDILPITFWRGLRIMLRMAKTPKSIPNKALKDLLTQKLGSEAVLGDFQHPVLAITATELESSHIRVFSTMTQDKDGKLNLVDVVMASTALPGAFPDYPIYDYESGRYRHYIDGGIWANAPLLAGVALAVEKGIQLAEIRVVNIGTSSSPYPSKVAEYRKLTVLSKGFYEYLFNLTSSATEDVSHEAVKRIVKNVLHIDEPLDQQIMAWEVKKAKSRLPEIAKTLSDNDSLTEELKELIN
jgi:uncharacterized protein